MGNFERASKSRSVKGSVATTFWSIVLIGSTMAIGAGFVGGRSIGSADVLPVADPHHASDLPDPIRQKLMRRSLFGSHSLDAASAYDPYGDPELGVADRPGPPAAFDARDERAKIAVIVVDAGSAGSGIDAFLKSPLPLTMVVAPGDDGAQAAVETIAAAGKSVVIDASSSSPDRVRALMHGDAHGVIASLDRSRSEALLHGIDRNAYVIDAALAEDDDVSSTARALHRRVFARDVIADARDDAAYVDFMFRDALAIAQKTGTAIVAVHARTMTFDALTRFADRAQRDGADIVALTDLGG